MFDQGPDPVTGARDLWYVLQHTGARPHVLCVCVLICVPCTPCCSTHVGIGC